MRRLIVLPLLLLAPTFALADDAEAKKLADDLLTKGASMFDGRDAKGLMATYANDAVFTFYSQDENNRYVKAEESRGGAIEDFYRKYFEGQTGATTSKNTVELARLLSSDVLVIHGRFQPDTSKDGSFPFVQVRVKQGDKWLIKSVQVFWLSK